jgi:hypothetical protein
MRGKLIFVLIAGAVVVAIAAGVRAYIQRGETEMMEHKRARTTSGVVLDKKHVQFVSEQTEYQNDEGRTVHLEGWRKKSGEFRIFYKIENFDQIPATHRSALVAAEEERGKRFGPRFRVVDQSTFDQAKNRQVVNVTYRWADDSKIEIMSFELAGQRNNDKL